MKSIFLKSLQISSDGSSNFQASLQKFPLYIKKRDKKSFSLNQKIKKVLVDIRLSKSYKNRYLQD